MKKKENLNCSPQKRNKNSKKKNEAKISYANTTQKHKHIFIMMHRKNRIEYRGRIWFLVDSLVEALIVGVCVREESECFNNIICSMFLFGSIFLSLYYYLTLSLSLCARDILNKYIKMLLVSCTAGCVPFFMNSLQ